MNKNIFLLAGLIFCSTLSFAVTEEEYTAVLNTDAPHSADHALLGRYEGSKIVLQSSVAFEDISFPIAASEGSIYSKKKRFPEMVTLAGKITRTFYAYPSGRSVFEVITNLTDELKQKGFQLVWTCKTGTCGDAFAYLIYSKENYLRVKGYDEVRNKLVASDVAHPRDYRYVLMKKNDGAGDTYVSLYIGVNKYKGQGGHLGRSLDGRLTGLIEIVEPKAMEHKIVTVDSKSIEQELDNSGAVSFYGLYFETGKSDLMSSSKEQLTEMAKFLKSNKLDVFIVGHTDSQGSLASNMSLSKARALSVVTALQKLGVPKNRLSAEGVGPLAPKSTNKTDIGRSKNRRVELILK